MLWLDGVKKNTESRLRGEQSVHEVGFVGESRREQGLVTDGQLGETSRKRREELEESRRL